MVHRPVALYYFNFFIIEFLVKSQSKIRPIRDVAVTMETRL